MLILLISNMKIKDTILNMILFLQEENRIMCFSLQTLIMILSKHTRGLFEVPLGKTFQWWILKLHTPTGKV